MTRSDDRRRLALDENPERVSIAAQHGVDHGPGFRVVHEGRLVSDASDWFDRSVSVLVGLIRDTARMA